MVATCSCGRSADQALGISPSKVIVAWIWQLPNSLEKTVTAASAVTQSRSQFAASYYGLQGLRFPALNVIPSQFVVTLRHRVRLLHIAIFHTSHPRR